MAQQHQRHRLTRHVAALSPAGQLVVGQLRHRRREGRRLGVQVHLRLPPPGRDRGDARRRRRPAGWCARAGAPARPAPHPAPTSESRRRASAADAPVTAAVQSGRNPARANATSTATVVAPSAARAGMAAAPLLLGHQGRPASPSQARQRSRRAHHRPPPRWPRARPLSRPPVSVSAVRPEDDTARTSVSAPTKAGTADPAPTQNGTVRSGAVRAAAAAQAVAAGAQAEGGHGAHAPAPHRPPQRRRACRRTPRRPPAARRTAARAGRPRPPTPRACRGRSRSLTQRPGPWPAPGRSRPWPCRRSCSASPTVTASSTQQHGHAVHHGVALLQPRVVEDVLVLEPQQWSLVDRAGQDVEQERVEAHRELLSSGRPRGRRWWR